jgi:hypothetical protein
MQGGIEQAEPCVACSMPTHMIRIPECTDTNLPFAINKNTKALQMAGISSVRPRAMAA